MINSAEYLSVLANVMQENRTEASAQRKNYDALYALVHSDLMDQLKKSHYPDAPALSKKANRILEEMEALYLCPELVGTGCLLVSNYHTNSMFFTFRAVFEHWETIFPIAKIQTQIPFLIVHDTADKLEVLNYANQRVELSFPEYEMLTVGSGQNRVALNKIVRIFILHTPLSRENVSLLFDNIYHLADDLFGSAICRRIACIEQSGFDTVQKRNLNRFDAFTCKMDFQSARKKQPALAQYSFMAWDLLVPCLTKTIHPVLYGFRYRFQLLTTQIECYYLRSNRQILTVTQEITEDIVRSGGTKSAELLSIRQTAQSRGKELSDEWYTLHIVLDKIDQSISKIEKDLQDICQSGKEVPRSVLDVVFEDFFTSVETKSPSAQKIDACLTTLGYPDRSLVQRYLQSRAGKTVGLPAVSVGSGEWEKAKMLLEILDVNRLSPRTLHRYVKMLEPDHFSTGKEYYAKSLTIGDFEDSVSLLTESFMLGYEPAGEQLLQMYQAGQNIDLSTLVYALLPEACVLMAQKQLYSNSDYTNLSKKGFTYYKLAAAKGHLPSIQFIVDKLYASDFAHAQSTGPHTARAENGRVLCGLCRYLLDHVYQVKHNSEILGVVLFCMGRSYSEAISLLAGIDTPVSNFCKGYMYHHGKGVASDLSMALKYYEQARVEGYQSQRFTRQLEECRSAKTQKEAQAKKSTTYKEEEHYSSHTTYHSSSSDSLCFITTAACRALHADDNCRELNLLRWFRDAKLQSTPQGETIVREYYRIGPLLVDAIEHSADPEHLYQSLWKDYIGPSCAAIEGQQWDTAKHIYIDMVKKLCHQFGVEVRPQILELLKNY